MAETITKALENVASGAAAATTSKPISTRTHAIIDYTIGPALMMTPQKLGLRGAAAAVPRAVGAASAGMGSVTQYELGAYPVVPMKAHLMIDAISGVFLAASPWLLGFGRGRKKRTWLPHLLVGASGVAIAALTDTRSTRIRR